MTAGDRAIRSVVVAGAGIVGLSAAIAFARALPGVEVTVLETPPDPADPTELLAATLPTVHRFHAAIGLDELALVAGGIALHRLGTRFDQWSSSGASWFHTFAEHGLRAGPIPFHQMWLRAQAAGRAEPFHAYSAAATLAASGRFIHPAEDPASPLATFLYGLNLNPALYRKRLEQGAKGLSRLRGAIAHVERRSDGGVAALVLGDSRCVAADLYLDCTGPRAQVLGRISGEYEDWTNWLPCDRMVLSSEPVGAVQPFDQVRGESDGWVWDVPLPDQTLRARVFASVFGRQVTAGIPLRQGRRAAPWVHNVLGLGAAAVVLDPLHGAALHLVHSAILRAIQLLPGRDMHSIEVDEYNRRARLEDERVRDFLALHYLRSGRADTPFWRDCARRAPPESLARTLDQFARRGRLPFFEDESFTADSWLAVLLGMGVLPAAIDPVSLAVDRARAEQGMAALAARIAALPERFPPYHRMLAGMTARRGSGG